MKSVIDEKLSRVEKIKNSSPIFVIGCQRSGTSFLYRLIQRYLKIGFGRDNGHFIRILKNIDYYGDLQNENNLRRLIKDILSIREFKKRFKGLEIDVDEFIRSLREKTYREIVLQFYAEWVYLNKKIRWGGKTPDYTFHVKELRELFPDAKFIHIIRDGRDVALSLFKLNWGPKNAFMAAHYWKKRVESAIKQCEDLDESSYLEIRYENLIQQTGYEFERLINFIEYEENIHKIMMRFNDEISHIVKRGNSFKWEEEMSDKEIRIFEQVAGRLLYNLGYEVIHREYVGKKFYMRNIYYILENAVRKFSRGEGFYGVYNKICEFFHNVYLSVFSYFQMIFSKKNI
jgi:hypothetical protein